MTSFVEHVEPKKVHLGDVASFIRGITFKPSDLEVPADDNVDCMRTKNVQVQLDTSDVWSVGKNLMKRPDQLLKVGDLLISSANSWNLVGKACWIPELARPTTFGGFVTVLRRTDDSIDPRYLYRWFTSEIIQATLRSFGNQTTNISNLDLKRARQLQIPLPPLPEQRRIAAILDKADHLRTQRREALAQLDALTQSIFDTMFGSPVANTMAWAIEAFETVAPSRLGKMLDKKKQTGLQSFDYIRNANVQWFNIHLNDLLQMDFTDLERIEFGLKTGDVLICEGGEPGRAAIWRGPRENCYFQKALHRARPHPEKVKSEYLVHLLWRLSHGGGLADLVTSATIAHLTSEKLKRLQIPVPPLYLQETFERRVAGIERLKEQHRTQLAELDTLFASLQHRAFAGKL